MLPNLNLWSMHGPPPHQLSRPRGKNRIAAAGNACSYTVVHPDGSIRRDVSRAEYTPISHPASRIYR